MPGCAAVDCSNSSEKGFLMKRFPKEPARRKEWMLKMRRNNWKPTDNSVLCEIHFTPEMWETTRVDGTRKLKCNAVPTVFSFSKQGVKRKAPTIRKRGTRSYFVGDHTYCVVPVDSPITATKPYIVGNHSYCAASDDRPITDLGCNESIISSSVMLQKDMEVVEVKGGSSGSSDELVRSNEVSRHSQLSPIAKKINRRAMYFKKRTGILMKTRMDLKRKIRELEKVLVEKSLSRK